jgi:hypothetical protein
MKFMNALSESVLLLLLEAPDDRMGWITLPFPYYPTRIHRTYYILLISFSYESYIITARASARLTAFTLGRWSANPLMKSGMLSQ